MNNPKLKSILIIGGGPSNIGRETELDSAVFNIVKGLHHFNVRTMLIDDNAYSLSTSEMNQDDVFIQPANEDNITQIIKNYHPDAILPVFGSYKAVHTCKHLYENGILSKYHVEVLGLSEASLELVGNPLRLNQLADEVNEPIVPSSIIHSSDEAFDVIRRMGLPVIVKTVLPRSKKAHKECKDMDSLAQVVNTEMVNSKVSRCVIEKSMVGNKELSMVGLRDDNGTKILVNGLEDIDAVGIHSGDSIAISPIQTITEPEYQELRNATFKIMDNLDINGFCEVSFALDVNADQYFVTKVNPYYTRGMALAEIVTGYPLNQVFTNLIVGNSLSDIKLSSHYHRLTAIMEPTVDRIMVRMPIWPFQDIKGLSPRLKQNMKSVGSAIGIGRTVEEALLKALRSSQFSPRDILPSMTELSDDQLINQLIHPQANRIQILIEALRRDYQIDDLTELTKIDAFYFMKLRHLLHAENLVVNRPRKEKTVQIAHDNGFGDGMLAATWHLSIDAIRGFVHRSKSLPTYKMMDPSAGEVIYQLNSFYSSYEVENEAQKLSNQSALVIGRGGNHLGPNTAADYYTSEVLLQLNSLGFKTIILNNNPNSSSLTNLVSDRRYLEPIQLGNILDIIALEQPQLIIVPGNRHYLVREIKKYTDNDICVLPPDQETNVELSGRIDFTLDFFVTADQSLFITAVNSTSTDGTLDHVSDLDTNVDIPDETLKTLVQKAQNKIIRSKWKGLVEVVVTKNHDEYQLDGIRPVRIIETIFLNRITNINWIHQLVALYTNHLDLKQLQAQLLNLKIQPAVLTAVYPYQKLGLKDYQPSPDYEVGGSLHFIDHK